MKKIYKNIIKIASVFAIISIVPFSLKASTIEELKNKFISLGGSGEGFDKIILVIQTSQNASNQLKDKITQVYNKQMFDIMASKNFDPKAYTDVYSKLEQDKAQLVNQNLNNMIDLLNALSLQDRQAYAKLLYGSNIPLPTDQPSSSNINKSNEGTQSSIQTDNYNVGNSNTNEDNSIN